MPPALLKYAQNKINVYVNTCILQYFCLPCSVKINQTRKETLSHDNKIRKEWGNTGALSRITVRSPSRRWGALLAQECYDKLHRTAQLIIRLFALVPTFALWQDFLAGGGDSVVPTTYKWDSLVQAPSDPNVTPTTISTHQSCWAIYGK